MRVWDNILQNLNKQGFQHRWSEKKKLIWKVNRHLYQCIFHMHWSAGTVDGDMCVIRVIPHLMLHKKKTRDLDNVAMFLSWTAFWCQSVWTLAVIGLSCIICVLSESREGGRTVQGHKPLQWPASGLEWRRVQELRDELHINSRSRCFQYSRPLASLRSSDILFFWKGPFKRTGR